MTDAENRAAPSGRFERFLEDVPRFVGSMFFTPYLLFREPKNLAHYVCGEGKRPKGALPPLTFLFTSAALASFAVSAFTNGQVDYTQIFVEIAGAPAGGIEGLFTFALPVALAILVWCYGLDALLIRHPQRRHQRVAFLTYAPAALLLALFLTYVLLALFNVAVGARVPEDYDAAERTIYSRGIPILAVLVLTMSFVLSRRVADGVLTFAKPRWRGILRTALGAALPLGVLVSICFSFGLTYAAVYANAPRNFEQVLTVVERELEPVDGGVEIRLKVLIENSSRAECTIVDRGEGSRTPMQRLGVDERLSANWPQLAWGYNTPIHLRLDRMALVDSPFVEVPAWGRAWVRLRGTLDERSMKDLTGFANDPKGVVLLVLPCVPGTKPGRALNYIWWNVSAQFATTP